MTGLKITKIVDEIKFEGVSGKLGAQKSFQRHTMFETNSSFYVKDLIFVLQEIFTNADKIFVLGERLGTRL